jgi:hypothetical protein
LILTLPHGTASCEAAIEILFNPQSAIRNPQSALQDGAHFAFNRQ